MNSNPSELIALIDSIAQKLKVVNEQEWNLNDENFDEFIEKHNEQIYNIIPREELEVFTIHVLDEYFQSNKEAQIKIKDLFRKPGHSILRLSKNLDPEIMFKYRLLIQCLFPDSDTRDMLVSIPAIFEEARNNEVNCEKIVDSILPFASSKDYYGMGSLRYIIEENVNKL